MGFRVEVSKGFRASGLGKDDAPSSGAWVGV